MGVNRELCVPPGELLVWIPKGDEENASEEV